MELVSLGVGDAFTARYWSTCAAVEAEGARLLIDCPHPIRRVLAGASLDVGDLDAVVITHNHADHVSGLEGLLFFSWFVLRRKLTLVAHPEVLADLWSGHLRAGMCRLIDPVTHAGHDHVLSDYAEIVPLDEARPVRVGPFSIACRRTIHHVPTFALRLEAGGASLGWSADTAYDEGLITWLAQADRLVHETNLGAHTPYEKLAALPEDLRRRMWLVHYLDHFDTEGSVIECLREGRRYVIGPGVG